jgi:hypothetical protein
MKTYEIVFNTDFILQVDAAEMQVIDGYAYFYTNHVLVATAVNWIYIGAKQK